MGKSKKQVSGKGKTSGKANDTVCKTKRDFLTKKLKRLSRNPVFATIISVLTLVIAFLAYKYGASEKTLQEIKSSMNSGIASIIETMNGLESSRLNRIDPERTAVTFQTGMEQYESHRYTAAVASFEEAVSEQEKLSGADSWEVGNTYCMLGLSRVYAGDVLSADGHDAVSAFQTARVIFERKGDLLGIAKCDYYLAFAYLSMGSNYLNTVLEYLQNSTNELSSYCPPEAVQLAYQMPSGERMIKSTFDNGLSLEENAELVCRLCLFYSWMQKDCELLGRFYFTARQPEQAVEQFNKALELNSSLLQAESMILTIQGDSVADAELHSFLDTVKESGGILSDTVTVEMFNTSGGEGESTETGYTLTVARSTDIASLLTRRAVSVFVMGKEERAIADCRLALDIWNSVPFSERTNASFTYTYLALASLYPSQWVIETSKIPEEKRQELLGYMEYAIQIERELMGADSVRYANILYSRGMIRIILEEYEAGLNDWREAYSICVKKGDAENAGFIKGEIENVSNDLDMTNLTTDWFNDN